MVHYTVGNKEPLIKERDKEIYTYLFSPALSLLICLSVQMNQGLDYTESKGT